MKNFLIVLSAILACATNTNLSAEVQSASLQDKFRGVFGDRKIEIHDYDDQLKEVIVDSRPYFATTDGRYVFVGKVLDTHRKVDIVAERESRQRQAALASQPKDLFVSYPSVGSPKHEVTVFTDIDCPYCRKLHNTMSAINQRGVSVNYVMLPRAGVGSASYLKTLSALCSDNPAETITRAMQGETPAPASCEPSQLNEQMALARKLNVASTPTTVLPNGQVQVGLVNPEQLVALLEGGSE